MLTPRKSRRLASKRHASLDDNATSKPSNEPINVPASPKPVSPRPSPIPTTPPPFTSPVSPPHTTTGFDTNPSVPPANLDLLLSKFVDLQSQLYAFQDEVRVSLASITDQLSQMETRLGAKLDTIEVQTEFIDEETAQ